MELQHINVKLYLERPEAVKLEAVVPVFHEWIQQQVCEELLIDVADYRHLHGGPGVVLVGHQADYSIDNTDNRLGVRYNRKADYGESNRDRFSQALHAALRACQRLESEAQLGGMIRFNRRDLRLFVNDRMLASIGSSRNGEVQRELGGFFASVLGGEANFEMRVESEPRRLFGVEVRALAPIDVNGLISTLA